MAFDGRKQKYVKTGQGENCTHIAGEEWLNRELEVDNCVCISANKIFFGTK